MQPGEYRNTCRPPWAPYLKATAKGEVSAELAYRLTYSKQGLDWQLSKGQADPGQLRSHATRGRNLPASSSSALTDPHRWQQQCLELDAATLKSPAITAVLDQQQQLDLADLLIPQKTPQGGKQPATPAKPLPGPQADPKHRPGSLTLTEATSGKPLKRAISRPRLSPCGPLAARPPNSSPSIPQRNPLDTRTTVALDGTLWLTPHPERRHPLPAGGCR